MAFRLTKAEKDRQAQLTRDLAEKRGLLQAQIDLFQEESETRMEPIRNALEMVNKAIQEASAFAEDIVSRIEEEMGDKSESWQESERGQAVSTWRDEWSMGSLEEVQLEEPTEVEVTSDIDPEEFENLPEAPEGV